jgi:hypothetical protein
LAVNVFGEGVDDNVSTYWRLQNVRDLKVDEGKQSCRAVGRDGV